MHTRLTVRLACCWVGSLLLLILLSPRLTVSPLQAAAPSSPSAQAGPACPALPPPTGNTVNVSTESELWTAVNTAQEGDTILLADGTYNLGQNGHYLWIDTRNVTLRSASGDREAVILDDNYSRSEIVSIVESDVTIADLTIKRAGTHPIHVTTGSSDTLNTLIYNVHIIDPAQQAIKINPNPGGYYPDNGVIACSHIELTDAGRPHVDNDPIPCYTGGIDAHQARGWIIRDNLIEGFWCDTGLSEHGVHMWRGCRDTLVERNVLNNNARGIGFGLVTSGSGRTYPDNPCPGASGYVDDFGGTIRNNFVFANNSGMFASSSGFDTGIALWNSCNGRVLHNTVYTTNPARTFSAVEWRFSNTEADIINNLVNDSMLARDGATATEAGNLTNAQAGWFVNAASGNLHLVDTATSAIDQVTAPADVSDDIDGDTRPIGSASDIGADEYGIPPPAAVTDLRVSNAVTDTGVLTATLRWTAPTDALTTTLRYAVVLITEANWNSTTLLTDTLTGSAEVYSATVPYSGDTVYFALKTEDIGGMSAISNNAFWPHRDVYLPLIVK